MFSIREVKRTARAVIKEKLGSVLPVSLVAALIIQLLIFLSMKISYGSLELVENMSSSLLEGTFDPEMMLEAPALGMFGMYINLALQVMEMIISAGFTYYAFLISRRAKAGLGDMFDIFTIFFRALGLLLLQSIYIFLWSLLFVIPGFIAAYRYSMAIYIMLDRPDISVVDCIRMSKEMTYGNKGKLFVLDLSFILWHCASFVCAYVFAENLIISAITSVVVSVFYMPYYNVTKANVYNRLSGYRGDVEGECSESPAEESFDASNWYDN